MRTSLLPFLKNLLVFSGIFGIVVLVLALLLPPGMITPALPFQFIFFIALTIMVFVILIKATQERFTRFLNIYLLITTGKLLLFLILLVLYVFLNRSDAISFSVSFFIFYLGFTTFEVASLLRYSKSQSK